MGLVILGAIRSRESSIIKSHCRERMASDDEIPQLLAIMKIESATRTVLLFIWG
jgi:hypothetical protein